MAVVVVNGRKVWWRRVKFSGALCSAIYPGTVKMLQCCPNHSLWLWLITDHWALFLRIQSQTCLQLPIILNLGFPGPGQSSPTCSSLITLGSWILGCPIQLTHPLWPPFSGWIFMVLLQLLSIPNPSQTLCPSTTVFYFYISFSWLTLWFIISSILPILEGLPLSFVPLIPRFFATHRDHSGVYKQ